MICIISCATVTACYTFRLMLYRRTAECKQPRDSQLVQMPLENLMVTSSFDVIKYNYRHMATRKRIKLLLMILWGVGFLVLSVFDLNPEDWNIALILFILSIAFL